MQIREARLDDISQLCALLAALFAQEADFSPDAGRQQRGLRLILDNPESGRIYCATESGTVIGMVTILFTISTAEGSRAAWLEDMVVHPEWRGRTIGRQLLNHAVTEAGMAGCQRLTLLTDGTNDRAMRFYSRAGFVRSTMVTFRLVCDQSEAGAPNERGK